MPRKRAAQTGIEPPQLPAHVPIHESTGGDLADHAAYQHAVLQEFDATGQAADDVLFEMVRCEGGRFAETQFSLPQFLDARLTRCDFAGAAWQKAHLRRVELVDCRLVGLNVDESSFDDVRVEHCTAELARFWSSTFHGAIFERCDLKGASFDGSDLSGVVFRGCDLTNADLRNTKLTGADLRGSTLNGLQVGVKELQGAIVDPGQAAQIAMILGLVVKFED